MIPRLELCLAVRAVLGDSRHLAGSSRGRQTRTHSEVACRQLACEGGYRFRAG